VFCQLLLFDNQAGKHGKKNPNCADCSISITCNFYMRQL